jgi:hypothetical protein
MDASFQELLTLVREKAANRLALIISTNDLRLYAPVNSAKIYILEVQVSNAAGGRGAGFGQRSIARVTCFKNENGTWIKTLDIGKEGALDGFEPPHHVSLMPLTLDDGNEVIVYGTVDPILVSEYDQRFGNLA